MDASSREEVFMALREQGIRPIKVVAADGAKANGEIHGVRRRFIALSILAGMALTAGLALLIGFRIPRDPAKSEAVAKLNASFDSIFADYGFSSVSLGLTRAIDYSAIEAGDDVKPILERIRQGQRLIDRTKQSVRDAFHACVSDQPQDGEVRRYAEVMARARLSELDGKVVFSDPNVERLYGYCLDGGR